MTQLKVYEFNQIKFLLNELLALYKTNDVSTLRAHKDYLINEIKTVLNQKDIEAEEFLNNIDDVKLSRKRSEQELAKLKVYVEQYDFPSQATVNKLFKKVKKLNTPNFETLDARSLAFIAWNDISSNRKYFVFKNRDDQFEGMYGEMSPNKIKGFCNICNQESKVALFLCKSKTSGDGNYKKKGDYICHDSDVCNANLTGIENLYSFIENVR